MLHVRSLPALTVLAIEISSFCLFRESKKRDRSAIADKMAFYRVLIETTQKAKRNM